jgi:hypothetical protein
MALSAQLQLFPLLKGEDYENVESNIVSGSYRAWGSGNSEGGAGELLLFRRLLRLLLRL